jgi:hypothetical protein
MQVIQRNMLPPSLGLKWVELYRDTIWPWSTGILTNQNHGSEREDGAHTKLVGIGNSI